MQNYKRSDRVAELIQQEISRIVLELKAPEKGFITITGVKLTDDLQEAWVYFSVLGGEEDVEKNRALLQKYLPEIRHQLAARLNLRRTPALYLEYDDTALKANKIFEILEKIKAEEAAPPAGTPEPLKKARKKTAKNDNE